MVLFKDTVYLALLASGSVGSRVALRASVDITGDVGGPHVEGVVAIELRGVGLQVPAQVADVAFPASEAPPPVAAQPTGCRSDGP
jgi:hypothetical protein